VRPRTDTQTDTQTRVTTIHFASSATHAKCNNQHTGSGVIWRRDQLDFMDGCIDAVRGDAAVQAEVTLARVEYRQRAAVVVTDVRLVSDLVDDAPFLLTLGLLVIMVPRVADLRVRV